MATPTRIMFFFLCFSLSYQASARSDVPLEDGAKFLVSACQETVEIYDKHGEAKLLAGQRTSLKEGIKAGYCLGVIIQYRKNAGYCDKNKRSVLGMAHAIADSNLTASQLRRLPMSDLLEEAYCGL